MEKRRKKRVTSPVKRFFRILLLIVLLATIGGVGYGAYLLYTINQVADDSYKELDSTKTSELREEEVTMDEDPVTILLTGIDDYVENDKGRADVLLLLALNPKTKEIAMVSIPRDTLAYIPDVGEKRKINSSYAYGDMEGTVETVQNFLDVPVDYYIKTGVDGFKDVVDELGGITVNVPFDFKQVDLDNKYVYFKKGEMDLDGREALAFVQMRYEDPEGDFGRQKRQQEAIRAMAEKAISLNTISKADKVIKTAGSHIETNIRLNELLGLRTFYEDVKSKGFSKLSIEGQDDYINGGYYFVPDEESVEEVESELKRILELGTNYSQDTSESTSSSLN